MVILLLTLFERSLGLLLAAIGGYVWIDLARVMRSEAARLRGSLGRADQAPYRYERDVEGFFRHSPAVVRDQRG